MVGWVRPADATDEAATAAVNAIWGDDPPAGAYGECRHAPYIGFIVLRARYSCVVHRCYRESARLDVTHNLLDGWSYRITRGGIPYVSPSGATSPTRSAATKLNPNNC